MSKLTTTLFDALGSASLERIHSQFIYWLFNRSDEEFSFSDKILLLTKLAGKEAAKFKYDQIECVAESDSIDLVIYLSKGTHKQIIIIENKLKSSEHSDQTHRYSKLLEEKGFSGKYIGVFLSLINEQPSSKDWRSIRYHELYDGLTQIKLFPKKNQIILDEYLLTLKNLTSVFNEFIKSHTSFAYVFNDGSLTKDKKREKYPGAYQAKADYSSQEYICRNGLETIFQKAFLISLSEKLSKISLRYPCHIGETHGTAFIEWYLYTKIIDGIPYRFGIQFQMTTVKLYFVYKPEPKEEPKIKMKEFLASPFCAAFKTYFKATNYTKENPPTSRVSYSFSKKFLIRKRDYSDYSKKEIIHGIEESMKEAISHLDSFLKKYRKTG